MCGQTPADSGHDIIKFDTDTAIVWGALLSNEKKDSHTIDKQIAAIALVHDLVMVTGDKGHGFSLIPNLRILNPFSH